MKILAVDDEQLMLDALTGSIHRAEPDAEVHSFKRGRDALAFAQIYPIDVAFLDIRMRGMDGLTLGKQLKALYPEINLIYCTSYDEYISEAFREVRCNGYITKPVDADAIANELAHLRIPMNTVVQVDTKVYFQCIGRFEVFIDNKPVKFENTKTKELLAVLVDAQGGICTNQEIVAILWDDDARHDSYFKKIRKDLLDTFAAYECDDVIFRQRGGLGINVNKVSCDFYDWKKINIDKKKPEDYMSQFSWANIPIYEW